MLEKEVKKLRISILLDKTSYSKKCENIVKDLLTILNKEYNNFENVLIESEFLLKNKNIEFCRNCKLCFKTSSCPLDFIDDMKYVKERIVESDLFIIASPVYEKNVSAFIKAFLDRVGYWCHLMTMLGKKCIIVITAKFNGFDEVCRYMYDICSQMGFNVIGIICNNSYNTKVYLKEEITFLAKRIVELCITEDSNSSNSYLESIYNNYRKIYHNYVKSDLNDYEYTYWIESREIDNFETFVNVILNKKNNNLL